MNIRKPTDYTTMFAALDAAVAAQLPQMELYCEIGRVVSGRSEKGAAVAASEYLQAAYPAADGFSPRNVRRMRAFYATYEESPETMRLAMHLGWTQNVAILEGCGSSEERAWYIRAALRFEWKKAKLLDAIESQAWLHSTLDEQAISCYTGEKEISQESECNEKDTLCVSWKYLPQPHGRVRDEGLGEESGAGVRVPYRIGGHQPGGDWQSCLSSGPRKLAEHGISCDGHAARQLTNADYEKYDLLIGMDSANLRNMHRICGGDFAGKLHLLMDYTDHPRDVADPWYTDDFEATWRDVLEGCQGLLNELAHNRV